jgi:hypothetical protein
MEKRRVKKMRKCVQGKSCDAADGNGQNSRLGAGLGAAGLASGFASSHFDGVDGIGFLGWVSVVVEMSWWCCMWAWSRDDG